MVRSDHRMVLIRVVMLALGILLGSPLVFAQSDLKGILLNRADSTAVLYATIHLNETDQNTITNENGEFVLSVPDEIKQCTFSITSIGCKTI